MRWTRWFAASMLLVGLVPSAFAQQVPVNRGGFDYIVAPRASGEERTNQPNLWIFEIQMKSMRMLELPIVDPKTRTQKNAVFHYIVYKAVNREIERKKEEEETTPANAYDPPPGEDIFAPSALLVTEDGDEKHVYKDEIYNDAKVAIERREKIKLLNCVQAMKPVPPASPVDDPNPVSAYYGVFLFRDIDPDADYYTVYLTGFSNGYKLVNGPIDYGNLRQLASNGSLKINNELWDGKFDREWRAAGDFENLFDATVASKPGAEESQWFFTRFPDEADDQSMSWRKTVMMKFWRPGDRLQRFEGEIRMQGDPIWIFRPDVKKPKAKVQAARTQ